MNKQRNDFDNLEDYDDYLMQIEDMIDSLIFPKSEEEQKQIEGSLPKPNNMEVN